MNKAAEIAGVEKTYDLIDEAQYNDDGTIPEETEDEKRRLNEQTLAYKAELDEKTPILAEMQEQVKTTGTYFED